MCFRIRFKVRNQIQNPPPQAVLWYGLYTMYMHSSKILGGSSIHQNDKRPVHSVEALRLLNNFLWRNTKPVSLILSYIGNHVFYLPIVYDAVVYCTLGHEATSII